MLCSGEGHRHGLAGLVGSMLGMGTKTLAMPDRNMEWIL